MPAELSASVRGSPTHLPSGEKSPLLTFPIWPFSDIDEADLPTPGTRPNRFIVELVYHAIGHPAALAVGAEEVAHSRWGANPTAQQPGGLWRRRPRVGRFASFWGQASKTGTKCLPNIVAQKPGVEIVVLTRVEWLITTHSASLRTPDAFPPTLS